MTLPRWHTPSHRRTREATEAQSCGRLRIEWTNFGILLIPMKASRVPTGVQVRLGKESEMKKVAMIALTGLLVGATFSLAGQKPSTGTILSETSVSCGTKKQGKKESTDLMCQQYKMRSGTNEYLIRLKVGRMQKSSRRTRRLSTPWTRTRSSSRPTERSMSFWLSEPRQSARRTDESLTKFR